jgi:hypothetical protein
MRIRQLLGIVLLTGACAMAAGTVSQLGGVLVKNQDSAAVITILANGAFTHKEYRPTSNLMLVDLAGVTIAQLDTKVHEVSAPGVKSYRVASYRSGDGSEVARLELTLAPGARVDVSEVQGGLELHVAAAAAMASTGAISRIQDISVTLSRQPFRKKLRP